MQTIHMSDIQASTFRVSTITCNGSVGTRVELTKLYEIISVVDNKNTENGFIYVIDRNGKETKGENPRKKRSESKKKSAEEGYRRFDNALSSYFKLRQDYYPSVKIFKNGTIQMTGLKTIEDGEKLHRLVFDTIKDMYKQTKEAFESEPIFKEDAFYVRMINSDFSVPYLIRRKELHHLLISEKCQNSCSFQPGTYPGVKLQYFWNPVIGQKNGICKCTEAKCFGKGNGNGHGECKKVTVSIFESGKILITGATNFEQINEAYNYICGVLTNHHAAIRKVYI
jgi:TATA-box binding protein (TBP) (component of TFIID and TFIIIB)